MTTFVDKELTEDLLVYCQEKFKIVYIIIIDWAYYAIFSVVNVENFNIIV